MEINVVDTNDPWMVRPLIQLREWKKLVIEIRSGPNGVERMINAIVKQAASTRSISVLRIYAHGHAGAINIAGGQAYALNELSGIGLENIEVLRAQLQTSRTIL